jgi:hypothetical protein
MLLAQKETYAKAISILAKHGFENGTAELKKEECIAVLTLGFGLKVSGKIAELKKQLGEEIAEGKSGAIFWRSMREATSEEAGDGGEGGPDGNPHGRKRPREETDPRPSPNTRRALEARLPEDEDAAREDGPRSTGGGESVERK